MIHNAQRRSIVLASVLVMLVSLYASPIQARVPEFGKQWIRNHPFQIGSCPTDTFSIAYFQELAMNSLVSNRMDYLVPATNAGMYKHSLLSIDSPFGQSHINFINAVSTHEDDHCWYMADEPGSGHESRLAEMAEWLRTNRPKGMNYFNVWMIDDWYLNPFLNAAKPDALMVDCYPFFYGSEREDYFSFMYRARNKCKQYGIPYLAWVQAWATVPAPREGHPGIKSPSESEMRMQVYNALTLGYKSIQYFTYGYYAGFTDYLSINGNTGQMFGMVKDLNPAVRMLGRYLRFLESTDYWYVPGAGNPTPAGVNTWNPNLDSDPHIQSITASSTGAKKDAVIGFFTEDIGCRYFMLTNVHRHPDFTLGTAQATALGFTITFAPEVQNVYRLNTGTGAIETLDVSATHSLTVTLPGGTGALFSYTPFSLSTLGGTVVINGGASGTPWRSVTLDLSSGNDDGSQAAQMRFSNDRQVWSDWETFAAVKQWNLTPGVGTKYVYAQFKDASGKASSIYYESIKLLTIGGSVVINDGVEYTKLPSVAVSIQATSNVGTVTQMRLGHTVDGSTIWGAWEPYAASKSWTLNLGDGMKTVVAQFRDNLGNTSSSCQDSIVLDTVPPSTPGTPTVIGAYTNSTSVTFSWVAASDAGSGVADYKCRIGTTPGGTDVFSGSVGNVLSKTITGIHGQTYYCRVQAVDKAQNFSQYSEVSNGITVDVSPPSTPPAPTDGGEYLTTTTVIFDWEPAVDSISGILSYDIQIGTTPGGNDVYDWNVGNRLKRTMNGMHGVTYYCRVRARDTAGNVGAWSQSSDGIMVDTSPPIPGTASSPPTATSSTVLVSYSGASDTGSGIRWVELWYKKESAGVWTNSGLSSADGSGVFNFKPAQGNGTYYFGLVAEDKAGNRSNPLVDNGSCSTKYTALPSITGKIALEDYSGDVTQVPVTVELRKHDGSTSVRTISLAADGSFILEGIEPGTYDLTFKTGNWLRKVIQQVVVPQ